MYDVEVESELGSISMVFKDGETHSISLRDAEFDSEVILPSSDDLEYDSQSTNVVTDSAEELPLQQQAAGEGGYHMPANNKALLANGYVYFHNFNGENTKDPKVVLTDSTEKIKGMLEARGYKVERPTETVIKNGNTYIFPVLPVGLFKTLTNYGVILIETHGGRRYLRQPKEFLPPPLQKEPNCGGDNSGYLLVTTEKVTQETANAYRIYG